MIFMMHSKNVNCEVFMNRIILNKALKTLKDRKTSAERIADANYKVALENKDFENIDKLMRSLTIEISKKEFWGKDSKDETQQLKELEKQRQEILEKNFGKDFSIAPHYSCPKCHDTGFDENEPCSCLKEIITSILLNLSGTARNLATFDNANFDLFEEGYREKIKLAYQKMEEWCEKFKTTKYKNIGLFGNTGVGKTFLTEAMANKLINLGNIVMFTSSFNLNNVFMEYHKAFEDSKQNIIAPYLDCDVLIIDDLGTEPIYKNVTLEYLYLIVNERYNMGKSIVFSTNLTPSEFRDRYGERILSRLFNKTNSLAIHLVADDARLKKQTKKD